MRWVNVAISYMHRIKHADDCRIAIARGNHIKQ
jgi:hypothetical protein